MSNILLEGQRAPSFELMNSNGSLINLDNLHGNKVVLYFYPKDDTPGCTTEACSFRDDIYQIRELKAYILGISTDDIESHAKFSKKYSLPFPLLSDKDGLVAKAYGSVWKMGPFSIAKRHSFIISPNGRIEKIYRQVIPEKHSREIIFDLKSLSSSTN